MRQQLTIHSKAGKELEPAVSRSAQKRVLLEHRHHLPASGNEDRLGDLLDLLFPSACAARGRELYQRCAYLCHIARRHKFLGDESLPCGVRKAAQAVVDVFPASTYDS